MLGRTVQIRRELGIHSRQMIYSVGFNYVAWKQWGERSTAEFRCVLEFVFGHLYLSLWLLAASLRSASIRRPWPRAAQLYRDPKRFRRTLMNDNYASRHA